MSKIQEIGDGIGDLLSTRGIRDQIAEIVMWERPLKTGMYYGAGLLVWVLVVVAEIPFLTVLGCSLLAQLLAFRVGQFMQTKGIILSKDLDLYDSFVVTPSPETTKTVVLVFGDVLRNLEESIKDLSLTDDVKKLALGFGALVVLSAVGRVLSLTSLMFVMFTLVFLGPLGYTRNREAVDEIVNTSVDTANDVLRKAFESTKAVTNAADE